MCYQSMKNVPADDQFHPRLNNDVYNEAVVQELRAATTQQEAIDALARIGRTCKPASSTRTRTFSLIATPIRPHAARRPSSLSYSNLSHDVHPVFSERAKRLLERRLEGLGRWIELVYDEAPYWLFFITNVVDALDESKSEIAYFTNSTKVLGIDSYAFITREGARAVPVHAAPAHQGQSPRHRRLHRSGA